MPIESRKHQYGKVFGHWRIKEFLGSGSGGKSAVFRLEHTESSGVESALKVVSLIEERGSIDNFSPERRKEYEMARKNCSEKAEREVLLMNDLQGNTNIVDYLDHTFVDWSDETGFGRDLLIRMEKLSDLRSHINTGRTFGQEEILKIGKDICSALILCHQRGILHRDIKPENIFINKNGTYKLGDFGISRIVSTTSSVFASTGIGTPQYWAPEQTSGNYDVRVDIYSLGLVLYELANRNRLPFAESSYIRDEEIHRRLLGEPLPAPCNADNALAGLILTACAFRPNDRFQTAEIFLKSLNGLGSQIPYSPMQAYWTMPAQNDGFQQDYRTMPAQNDGFQQNYRTMPAQNDASQQVYRTVPAQGMYHSPQTSTASLSAKNSIKNRKFWPWILAVLAVSLAIILFMPKSEPSDTSENDGTQASQEGNQIEKVTETNPPATQHEHRWEEATYNAPKTCTTCGATEGTKKTPSSSLGLRDIISNVEASSIYFGDDLGTHEPEKMYDGRLDTNWTENAPGNGVGEYVVFYFDDTYAIKNLRIYIGSHFNKDKYIQNCRPKVITLTFSDGSTKCISLKDSYDEQTIAFDQYYYTDYVMITIDEVYTGTMYQDAVIAELDFVAYYP